MSTTTHTTREAWLVAAVEALAPRFLELADTVVPPVRVSVGWPGGRGNKTSVIGQCWAASAAADDVAQVFISPVLSDSARVLDVLAHELVHAAVGHEAGHKAPFAKVAKAIGLEGKMTATTATEELTAHLRELVEDELGEYPHAALTPELAGVKKQGTRMLKVVCPDDGYTLRTTAKWLAVGLPTCPCGTLMEADA